MAKQEVVPSKDSSSQDVQSQASELSTCQETQNPYVLPCPALAYLNSLDSENSIRVMRSHIYKACTVMWQNVPNAKTNYEKDLAIASSPWHLLSRDIVNKLKRVLQKTKARHSNDFLSPTTINTILAAIKGVAKEAKIKRIIDIETYGDIKDVKSVKGSRANKGRALNVSEISTLLKGCLAEKSSRGIRDYAIISTMFGCGLRRSEIVSLRIQDINFKNAEIKVLGKGNKEAAQPMPDTVMEAIELWLEDVRGDSTGESDALFVRFYKNDTISYQSMTSQAIYTILQERGLTFQLDRFTPHDLRRTYATWLLENGEDLIVVRDLMRHSSILTTQNYRIVERQRMHKAVQNIKPPVIT